MTAAPLPVQWNPDTWGDSTAPVTVADVPDPGDLHDAATRIRRDLGQHLPDHTITAELLTWVADVIAAGAPVRLPIGLCQWMGDVIKDARGEEL